METVIVVALVSVCLAAYILVSRRSSAPAGPYGGDLQPLTVEGWSNVESWGDATVATLVARTASGRDCYYPGLLVDDAWMKQLIGKQIACELLDDEIIRFRPTWKSAELLDLLESRYEASDRSNEDDFITLVLDESPVGLATLGDWMTLELEWDSPFETGDFLVEIEWHGEGDHHPLFGDEIRHDNHLVRIIDDGRKAYRELVEPRIEEFLSTVSYETMEVVFDEDTVSVSMSAVPCEAAFSALYARAIAVRELLQLSARSVRASGELT